MAHKLTQIVEGPRADPQHQVISHGIGCHDLADHLLVRNNFLVVQDHFVKNDSCRCQFISGAGARCFPCVDVRNNEDFAVAEVTDVAGKSFDSAAVDIDPLDAGKMCVPASAGNLSVNVSVQVNLFSFHCYTPSFMSDAQRAIAYRICVCYLLL